MLRSLHHRHPSGSSTHQVHQQTHEFINASTSSLIQPQTLGPSFEKPPPVSLLLGRLPALFSSLLPSRLPACTPRVHAHTHTDTNGRRRVYPPRPTSDVQLRAADKAHLSALLSFPLLCLPLTPAQVDVHTSPLPNSDQHLYPPPTSTLYPHPPQ
ncbi:hypothetical protein AB1N83_012402 [Pleurotus pulmonarius]